MGWYRNTSRCCHPSAARAVIGINAIVNPFNWRRWVSPTIPASIFVLRRNLLVWVENVPLRLAPSDVLRVRRRNFTKGCISFPRLWRRHVGDAVIDPANWVVLGLVGGVGTALLRRRGECHEGEPHCAGDDASRAALGRIGHARCSFRFAPFTLL